MQWYRRVPLWMNCTVIIHYNDIIMGAIASQITSLKIVNSTVYSGADQMKTSKLRVTGLCAGNSLGTGEFPAQMASNAENVSIWWRHHDNTHPVPEWLTFGVPSEKYTCMEIMNPNWCLCMRVYQTFARINPRLYQLALVYFTCSSAFLCYFMGMGQPYDCFKAREVTLKKVCE